jgi:type 1 fimbria pilin
MTIRSVNMPADAALAWARPSKQGAFGMTGTTGRFVRLVRDGLVAALVACAAVAPRVAQAQAQPVYGRWTFTANIRGTTCTVNSPPVVRLPHIQASALAVAGQTAGTKPVELTLTGCDPSIRHAQFTFLSSSDPVSPTYFKTDTGAGQAQGVAILLATGDGTQLQADGVNNVAPQVPVTGGQAKLQVFVSYVGNGRPVTVGNVTSRIEFEVSYP